MLLEGNSSFGLIWTCLLEVEWRVQALVFNQVMRGRGARLSILRAGIAPSGSLAPFLEPATLRCYYLQSTPWETEASKHEERQI